MGFNEIRKKRYPIGECNGYKVYQVGNMIGHNFYGTFFAAFQRRKYTRWILARESESKTLLDLKKWVYEHPMDEFIKSKSKKVE